MVAVLPGRLALRSELSKFMVVFLSALALPLSDKPSSSPSFLPEAVLTGELKNPGINPLS